MKKLKQAWLTSIWFWGLRHRLYSEVEPEATAVDVGLSILAKKMTRNRYTWGKPLMQEHRCKVCGTPFWTLSDVPYCKRLRCYLEWHMYPKIYQRGGTSEEAKVVY